MKPLVLKAFLKDIILRVEKKRNVKILSFGPKYITDELDIDVKDLYKKPKQDTEYVCKMMIYSDVIHAKHIVEYHITYSGLRLYNTRSLSELIVNKIDSDWMDVITSPILKKEVTHEWRE